MPAIATLADHPADRKTAASRRAPRRTSSRADMVSRRGSGDGAIYQMPNGRYRAAFDQGLREGRRVRTFKTLPTKTAAAAWLREQNSRRDEGLPAIDTRTTVAQWLALWLLIAKPNLRYKTWQGYELNVRLHLIPTLGGRTLAGLTPEHVDTLLLHLAKEGLRPATVRLCHATLRRALEIAVRRGHVARNVAKLVDGPRVEPFDLQALTRAEARQLLAAASADPDEARWIVGLCLGARQGEVLGLQWSDIDWEQRTLTIRRAVTRTSDRQLALADTKTRKSRRTLALPDQLVASLQRHRAAQARERLSAGPMWSDLDLIFCTDRGQLRDSFGDRRAFHRLLAQAGITRHIRLHDLRHAAATLMLAAGVPLKVVSEQLGHSRLSTTADVYAHLVPELHQDAARLLASSLFNEPLARKAPAS